MLALTNALLIAALVTRAAGGSAPSAACPPLGIPAGRRIAVECASSEPATADDEEALDDTSLLQTGLQRSAAPGPARSHEGADGAAAAADSSAALLQALGATVRHLALKARHAGSSVVGTELLVPLGLGTMSSEAIYAVVAVLVVIVLLLLFMVFFQDDRTSEPASALLPQPASPQQMSPKDASARPSIVSVSRPATGAGMPPTSGLPPAWAVQQPQVRNDEPDGPPPICASLILPNTEARFMVKMESLLNFVAGDLDIMGTSGRKLLNARIEDSANGGRSLALASDGCEDAPRVKLSLPPGDASGPSHVLNIYGRGDRFYGTLEASGAGGSILRYQGLPVLHLEPGSVVDLAMRAVSYDGRELAMAGRNIVIGGRRPDPVHWRLHVKPNVDAVLMAACTLATVALLPGNRVSVPNVILPRPSQGSVAPSSMPTFPRTSMVSQQGR